MGGRHLLANVYKITDKTILTTVENIQPLMKKIVEDMKLNDGNVIL